MVEYIYDAYGVPTVSFPGITEDMSEAEKQAIYLLGNNNPFRYRGYYFDTESGLYYLNSRYYDPVIGRFINADGYASTGQGVLGNNMFAYCGNEPVSRSDSSGQLWRIVGICVLAASLLFVTLSSCKKPEPVVNYGCANEYVYDDSNEYNCYAYALGDDYWRHVGGHQDAITDYNVESVGDIMTQELNGLGIGCRPLEKFDSPISPNEYRIALRTGESGYHFMKQHSDGSWSHKPGLGPTMLIKGDNPSVVSWDLYIIDDYTYSRTGNVHIIGTIENYYDSSTLYYAISK